MSVLFWIIVILAVYGMKIRKDGFFEDYISYRNIQPMKGIFILLVFISHFVQYMTLKGPWDVSYFEVRRFLGQLVVVPFLFYSGYGVAESVGKKGRQYVTAMPKNRILKVLFQFDLVVIVYAIQRRVLVNDVGMKRFLLALIGWESVGNSNWYIFAVVCLYLITWLAYLLFSRNKYAAAAAVTVLSVAYMVILKPVRDPHWYNTILAYSAGIWYSSYREKLEKILFSSEWIYGLCLAGVIAGIHYLRPHWSSLIIYETVSVLFALACVLISMKVQITNRFLHYCGEHLFSLFILQRLPMIALNNSPVEKEPMVYFALCFVLTLLMSAAFDKFTPWLWNTLFGKKKAA